jgi:polyisoprenoid-binding protein YceI
MNDRRPRSFAAGLCLLAIAGTALAARGDATLAAQAGERTLQLDPAATEIHFTLGATLHTVHGTAKLAEGELRIDPAARTLAGRVVVDAASAETGNDGRDRKMHDEILETQSFPQIVFLPERYEGELAARGESTLTVHGTLELHGDRHPVTLPATVDIQEEGAGATIAVHLTLTVPFVEWGLKDPSTFVLRVAKQVEVTIDARGRWRAEPPSDAEAPDSGAAARAGAAQ